MSAFLPEVRSQFEFSEAKEIMSMVELLGLQALDISVPSGTDVVGELTWKNISIDEGSSLMAVFLLGKDGNLYTFTSEGVECFIGSIAAVSAPSPGTTITTAILSKAAFNAPGEESTIWDAMAMIGVATDTIHTISTEDRIVGISKADIDAGNLSYYVLEWYTGVLTVTTAPPGVAAEITGFEFLEG